ncbi:MAG TPA: hypothetical protein VK457_01860 [Chloroflexota bacterium]|nr:hypothetical protein [Chloroflexota bacterium]
MDQRLAHGMAPIRTQAQDALLDISAGLIARVQHEHGLGAAQLVVRFERLEGSAPQLPAMFACEPAFIRHVR